VTVAKRHDNNRPQTLCKITSLGRRRYLEYLEVLEQVILDGTRPSSEPDSASRRQVNS
jgi:hypothetical protein